MALVGPGLAKPAPYPPVLAEFFKDMIPKGSAPAPDISLPSDLGQWHSSSGRVPIYLAPVGPVIHPQLDVHTFDTSLGQANAVGNIYYATYYQWQGMLRDHYLQRLLPDYFGGIGERGEAVCLGCRVDHLREAMPFDKIMVRMALKSLYETRAHLHFDYYRLEEGGAPVKLAWGTHQMVWVQRDALGQPREAPFPAPLRHALETAISNDSQVQWPVAARARELLHSQKSVG